jgi:hypothetical protein
MKSGRNFLARKNPFAGRGNTVYGSARSEEARMAARFDKIFTLISLTDYLVICGRAFASSM